MPQIHISDSNLTIENKIFSASNYAKEEMPDGSKRGTFRSYSVLVDGDNVRFKNCVFENTAGRGKDVGQAIALYLDGDGIILENCILRGHQDTLFLAPLPDKEIIPGGFIGPKQFTERKRRTYYFKNCVIEGGVDFIFGGATAYFEGCEFVSVEDGYIFAPSTPEDVAIGFVAEDCRFTASDNVGKGSCFIARPWRNHAYVKLENCYLGEHINPAGFDDWGKLEAHETVRFFEYNSYGPGATGIHPDYVNKACD
ncbi:MAG: pectin methylesterase [Clostridia bacterium]|nr:pectin methylesterase [Clostridia bacterium]